MRKKVKLLVRLFAFDIFACFIIQIWLISNLPNPEKPINLSRDFFDKLDQSTDLGSSTKSESKIVHRYNYLKESKLSFLAQSLLNNSFTAYWTKCKNSDYIQPISKNCLNSSGLSLTAIQSLQMLFIAGFTDEFQKVEKYILTEYRFNSSKYQNMYEMGSKVLGSLLGIFGFTHNFKYIEQATKCADLMLNSFINSIPYPIIDGIKNRPKTYIFLDGNILSESSSFIFEFSLLSKITKNDKYSKYVINYLNCIEKLIKESNSLPFYLSVDKCSIIDHSRPSNNTIFELLNEYTASFIGNLMRLHLFRPTNQTNSLLDLILNIFSKSTLPNHSKLIDFTYCQLLFLMDKIPKMKSSKLYKNLDTVCQNKRINKHDWMINSFLMKKDDFLIELINSSICGSYQCSLVSIDPLISEDFMPSESFSKWLKLLLIRNLTNFTYSPNDWIFNEAGHFIPIRFD